MDTITDTCLNCGRNVRLDCQCVPREELPAEFWRHVPAWEDLGTVYVVRDVHTRECAYVWPCAEGVTGHGHEYALLTYGYVPSVVAVHPLARMFPAPEGTSWADHLEAHNAAVSDDEAAAYEEYLRS